MSQLENSNRRLLEGLVRLLRNEVDGWPLADGENFSEVENVWTKSVPTKEDGSKTFPCGVVDIISGNDVDLSVELDVKLREVTVKLVVFGENSGRVEDLVDSSEDAISEHWEDYVGDWSFRETDGFTPLNEDEGVEGRLRYSRSQDFMFEVVKTTSNYSEN